MSSHKNTPENIPENIIFTEEEEKALKILVQEKIKKIDINKYISIRSFFNDITLYCLPHLPYSKENVVKWNDCIGKNMEFCVPKTKDKAITIPKVHPEKFYEFLQKLINLDIIDIASLPKELSTECLKHTLDKLNQILYTNNPTL